MKVAVVGGAGAMGSITVRDLAEFADAGDEILIADFDLEKAKSLASSLKSKAKIHAAQIDVRDHPSCVQSLAGMKVIVNSVQYQWNLDVMRIALDIGAHYVDLGGLFHMTRKQLHLDREYREKNITAVLGMGAAPGITNLLAALGAKDLDTVHEIHCRVAGVDLTKYSYVPALPVSYSLQTILEEFSYNPAVFKKGQFEFVEAMSGDLPVKFPPPIGVRRPMYTIHSEVATLPLSFKEKGVREVSFKIAFDPLFVDRVRFLRDMGLASHEPVSVRGQLVVPIELVNKVAMSQKPSVAKGSPKAFEIVRTVVKGTQKKKKVTMVLDCHTSGIKEWGIGTDVNTGCPPAIVAKMLSRGEITGRGCLAPEIAVEPELFFKALAKRKMKVKLAKKSGWSFVA